jgi:hypothetical protein
MTMNDTKGSMMTIDSTTREKQQLYGAAMTGNIQSTEILGPATMVKSSSTEQLQGK